MQKKIGIKLNSFSLPNSVSLLKDKLVVADGGNNRICLFDKSGEIVKCIGGFGYGKYKFKEPVGAFVSPKNNIYVMDWHNHRVVIYDNNLIYINEFGHFGNYQENGSIKHYLKLIKSFSSNGSYLETHFNTQSEPNKRKIHNNRLLNILRAFYYYFTKNKFLDGLLNINNKSKWIDKPNGIAFDEELIYLSQKNNKCVSVYKNNNFEFEKIRDYFTITDIDFGRLGNVKFFEDNIFICDERNNVIYYCDKDFNIINKLSGNDSGVGEFLPFSCDIINEQLLVVCGGLNFQIIDYINNKVIYCSDRLGELHGLAFDKDESKLYLANRSQNNITVYKLFL